MRDWINRRSLAIVTALLLEGWALYVVMAPAARWRPALIVQDEPAARALYDTMIRTMQQAESLSYTSVCSAPGARLSSYQISLKKPHAFRVDQYNSTSLKSTTLLDDGDHLWVYWSGDRLTVLTDTDETRDQGRSNAYLKEPSLAGVDSLCDRIALLRTASLGLIFDPTTFHGYADPRESCIDGIRSRGVHPVRGEVCDVIEISFMEARRTRYFWLSREDHLPRRIKEIVRGAETTVTVEEWSDVKINSPIPSRQIAWEPPQGWRQWAPPQPADLLLPKGQEAPDFELRSAGGGKIKLSDYRGRVVWLYIWDTGSPQCRREIPNLQWLHGACEADGLTVLGFNCTDDRRIARRFLREHSATFPTILDSCDVAGKLLQRKYGHRTGLLPLSYVINPQGRVVDAWFGPDQDPDRILAALERAGLWRTRKCPEPRR